MSPFRFHPLHLLLYAHLTASTSGHQVILCLSQTMLRFVLLINCPYFCRAFFFDSLLAYAVSVTYHGCLQFNFCDGFYPIAVANVYGVYMYCVDFYFCFSFFSKSFWLLLTWADATHRCLIVLQLCSSYPYAPSITLWHAFLVLPCCFIHTVYTFQQWTFSLLVIFIFNMCVFLWLGILHLTWW